MNKILPAVMLVFLLVVPADAAQLFPPQNNPNNPTCPNGEVLQWLNNGVSCVDPTNGVTVICPVGQMLTGIDHGQPICIEPMTTIPACNTGQYLTNAGGTLTCVTGPQLVSTESVNCSAGQGFSQPAGCAHSGSNGTTQQYSVTSNGTHQLCLLSNVQSLLGGLLGSCNVTGTPGGHWNLSTAVPLLTQLICSMTCYDFQ